mgnify:CR=1 FL=1
MASTYLSRTLGTATNRKKFTISLWFKKASNSGHQYFLGTGVDGNNNDAFSIHSTIQSLKIGGYESGTTYELKTNASLRDNSAWYNAVVSFDSTQSTDTNRLKMYINGEQVTSFATAVYPSLNYEPLINKNTAHNIGAAYNASGFFDGSISHFHFIDGTAYDASAFGSTDSTTGEWKINTSPSVTYGTNGFFILKDGNTITDSSPNSNNFTLGAGTLTKTEDCPSNVFATLNPLIQLTDATLSNGNNSCAYGSAGSRAVMLGTLGMPSGKYYMEFKISASSYLPECNGSVGVINGSDNSNMGTYLNQDNSKYQGAGYQLWDGNKNINQTASAYGATVAVGDIVGMAVDIDNKALYFHKNGAYQNSGSPTSGASKTGAIDFSSLTDNGFWFPLISDASGTQTMSYQCNFGNGYFGTTAVSSAGTNASGIGIFEYDVPTNYTALSTKGLNL